MVTVCKHKHKNTGMLLTASREVHRVCDGVIAIYAESHQHVRGGVRHSRLKQGFIGVLLEGTLKKNSI